MRVLDGSNFPYVGKQIRAAQDGNAALIYLTYFPSGPVSAYDFSLYSSGALEWQQGAKVHRIQWEPQAGELFFGPSITFNVDQLLNTTDPVRLQVSRIGGSKNPLTVPLVIGWGDSYRGRNDLVTLNWNAGAPFVRVDGKVDANAIVGTSLSSTGTLSVGGAATFVSTVAISGTTTAAMVGATGLNVGGNLIASSTSVSTTSQINVVGVSSTASGFFNGDVYAGRGINDGNTAYIIIGDRNNPAIYMDAASTALANVDINIRPQGQGVVALNRPLRVAASGSGAVLPFVSIVDNDNHSWESIGDGGWRFRSNWNDSNSYFAFTVHGSSPTTAVLIDTQGRATTGINTSLAILHNNVLKRVYADAANSATSGYRQLMVAN